MIEAVIFDMDGLLIDTECYWPHVESLVFTQYGFPITPEEACATKGLRADEVLKHWAQKRYPNILEKASEIEESIWDEMGRTVREKGKAMAGVASSLSYFKEKGLPLAVASSSRLSFIELVVDQLGFKDFFQVLCSAQHDTYGKPHPSVYLRTAEQLGVAPSACLALEDSVTGLISAKAARMACIAVPHPDELHDKRFHLADAVLASLDELPPLMDQTGFLETGKI